MLYARALQGAFIEDFNDIRDPSRELKARQAVAAITGHSSGISFDYFMMLTGNDSFVKADRMICHFVAQACDKREIPAGEAKGAMIAAYQLLSTDYPNLTPRLLDHLVWKYQRAQRAIGKRD